MTHFRVAKWDRSLAKHDRATFLTETEATNLKKKIVAIFEKEVTYSIHEFLHLLFWTYEKFETVS